MRIAKFAAKTRRTGWRAGAAAAWAVCLALVLGCSGESRINPVFRIEGEQLDRAINAGANAVSAGTDPNDLLSTQMEDVNLRVSSGVILRSAGCVWPSQEVACEIAKGGDNSDAGIRRAVNTARRTVEREMKCVALIQVPNDKDPSSVTFALRTNTAVQYPATAVETPVFVREVTSVYDPTAAAGALYFYVIRFPVRGGPGVPPVGPEVTALSLVVMDGEAEAQVTFPIPKPRR
jgi:hypothetical protein